METEPLQQTQIQDLDRAFRTLEEIGGVPEPTRSPLINGRWTLLFTTRPGSASPIQRTFTGVDRFTVFQEVDLAGPTPRVNNVVDFGGGIGCLRVEALASTDDRPLANFTPRQGSGLILGLAIFGQSTNVPRTPFRRADFQFDTAYFEFLNVPILGKLRLPYPVPFRLLGDEARGWIDTTYLSADGQWRLSRGNKGTLFVLRKAGDL